MRIQLHDNGQNSKADAFSSVAENVGIDLSGLDKNWFTRWGMQYQRWQMNAFDSIFGGGQVGEQQRLKSLIAKWRANNWGALMNDEYTEVLIPRKGVKNLAAMSCAELSQYERQFREYMIPYYSNPANYKPGTKERVVNRYAAMIRLFHAEVVAALKTDCGIDLTTSVNVRPAGEPANDDREFVWICSDPGGCNIQGKILRDGEFTFYDGTRYMGGRGQKLTAQQFYDQYGASLPQPSGDNALLPLGIILALTQI